MTKRVMSEGARETLRAIIGEMSYLPGVAVKMGETKDHVVERVIGLIEQGHLHLEGEGDENGMAFQLVPGPARKPTKKKRMFRP